MAKLIDIETGIDLDLRKLTLEVSENEDFSKLIIDSSNDGILTYDRDFRYTIWNPALERMTGKKRAEVVGQFAFEAMPFLRDSSVNEAMKAAIDGRMYLTKVSRFDIPRTGKYGFFQSLHSPLRNERGQVVGGLAVVRDLTELHEAEAEIRRLNESLQATFGFMTEVSKLLTPQTRDVETAKRTLVALATKQFDGWCYLQLLKPDGNFDCLIGNADPAKQKEFQELEDKYPLRLDVPFGPRQVLKTRVSEFRPRFDDPKEEHKTGLASLGVKSFLCVPIMGAREAYGTITLLSSDRHYTEQDKSVAECMAQRFAFVLEVSRLEASRPNGS